MANLIMSRLAPGALLLSSFFGAFSSLAAGPESFRGEVVGISDGDTLKVLREGREQKIRLQGVDCPESSQAFGTQAKKLTSDLSFNEEVEVKVAGHDRYGRLLGEISLPDRRNLNQELVKQGLCWWYERYTPTDNTMKELQNNAKVEKRGLWKDPNPVPPWEFRKLSQKEAVKRTVVETSSDEASDAKKAPIIGNKRSHLYHKAHCPGYSSTSEKNQIPFQSEEEAKKAGYTIAGNCK